MRGAGIGAGWRLRRVVGATGVLLAGAALGLVGCADDLASEGTIGPRRPDFFDLAAFVAAQDSLLAGRPVEKTVTVNGASQTLRIDTVDWAAELAPFAQCNLDRPALWAKYRVDSVRADGGGWAVTYASLDSSLFTRVLQVSFDAGGSVTALEVDNRFSSTIADTEQRLTWRPGEYGVYSRQDATMVEPRVLTIVGTWHSGDPARETH